MQKLNILNTRDVKKIRDIVIKEFGCFLQKEYAFLQSDKNKVFIVNKDVSRIDLDKLRLDRLGLYFAEVKPDHVRLSKEGAALLVQENEDVKNTVILEEKEVKAYFAGVDLPKDLGEENRLVILMFKDNVLGCAQYKDKKILNFLPKIHRGEVIV
ncbi:hypothetical protein COV20_05420 [Candidatus Woesearchaeota archaeon CG10_big_fil_rev_8_21_14_0_10_45_16]|nr:MAG: hypothetical protein COV20_05420 [Candidatus Woesearchaeota archaeon CG10_big_fil_rev_8_21_14_0_10_45_16]